MKLFGFRLLAVGAAVAAFPVAQATNNQPCTVFELWNADDNTPTGNYLSDGQVICQTPYDFNIEAKIDNCPTNGYDQDIKVRLSLNGPVSNTKWEGRAPYTVFGDQDANPAAITVNGYPMALGEYTMYAKMTGTNGTGPRTVLHEHTITFTVESCDSDPGNPDPECAAASCGNFIPCNEGGSCDSLGACVALSDDGSSGNGGGLCLDGSTPCAGLIGCPNGVIDCPNDGSLCFIDSCCAAPVCVPPAAFCSDPERRAMRGLAAFNPRKLDEDELHIGY